MPRGASSTMLATMSDLRNEHESTETHRSDCEPETGNGNKSRNGDAHEDPVRHSVHAVERELHHLDDVADDGESGATPFIVVGKEIRYLVPFVAFVIALALGAFYVTAHHGDSSKTRASTTNEHAGAVGKSSSAPGNATAGQAVFASNCSTCHGATGHGGNGGPDLTGVPSAKRLPAVVARVEHGGGGMPPFEGTLSDQQIRDVAAYVTTKISNPNSE